MGYPPPGIPGPTGLLGSRLLGSTVLPPDAKESKWLMRRFLLDLRQKIDEDTDEPGLEIEQDDVNLRVDNPRFRPKSSTVLWEAPGMEGANKCVVVCDCRSEKKREDEGNEGPRLNSFLPRRDMVPESSRASVVDANRANVNAKTGADETGGFLGINQTGGENIARDVDSSSHQILSNDKDTKVPLCPGKSERHSQRHEGGTIQGPKEEQALSLTGWLKSVLPYAWGLEDEGSCDIDNLNNTESERHRKIGGAIAGDDRPKYNDALIAEDNDAEGRDGTRNVCCQRQGSGGGGDGGGVDEEIGTLDGGLSLSEIGKGSLALWLKERTEREM